MATDTLPCISDAELANVSGGSSIFAPLFYPLVDAMNASSKHKEQCMLAVEENGTIHEPAYMRKLYPETAAQRRQDVTLFNGAVKQCPEWRSTNY